jgi:Protein of unknown function (DUF3137)
MQSLQDFRVFYNQSIYPELMHLERRRRRLVRLLTFSVLVFLGVFFLAMFLDVLVLSLLLLLLIGFWMAQLALQTQIFFKEFKPRIIGSVLDFVDNEVNYTNFKYVTDKFIPKSTVLNSHIFLKVDDYTGEDYISGQIREMPFEMSELTIHEFSPVRNRLNYVFKGVFFVGDFQRPKMTGKILLLPDAYRKYLSRSERAFNLLGGKRVQKNLLPEFEAIFDTYATPDARIKTVLSVDMQRALLAYKERTKKEIYVSIIEDKIYLAVSQEKDLMEPNLFYSNVSFEVIREFYEDIQLLLSIVKDIDVMN